MLAMTPEATEAVHDLLEEKGLSDDCGIRVYASSEDDGQRAVRMTIADRPIAGDQVSESDGAKLFVASEVAEVLADSVIDVRVDGDRRQFVLHSSA